MVKTYPFLPFSTPIIQQDLAEREKFATLGRLVEKVWDIKGNKRPVSIIFVSQVSNLVTVKSLPRKKQSLMVTLLKIAALVTFFPIFLTIKYIYRSLNQFVVEPIKFKKRELSEKTVNVTESTSKIENQSNPAELEEEVEEEEEDGDELSASIPEVQIVNDGSTEETISSETQESPHEIIEDEKKEEPQEENSSSPETETLSTSPEISREQSPETVKQDTPVTSLEHSSEVSQEQTPVSQNKVTQEPENITTSKEETISTEGIISKSDEKPPETAKITEPLPQETKPTASKEAAKVESVVTANKPINKNERKKERQVRREIANPNLKKANSKKSAPAPAKSAISTSRKAQQVSTANKTDTTVKKMQPKKATTVDKDPKKSGSSVTKPKSKEAGSGATPTPKESPVKEPPVKAETPATAQNSEQILQKVSTAQVIQEVPLAKKEILPEKTSTPVQSDIPKPLIQTPKESDASVEERFAHRFKNIDPNTARRDSMRFIPKIVKPRLDFNLLYTTGKDHFDKAQTEEKKASMPIDNAKPEEEQKVSMPDWAYVSAEYCKALDCLGPYILEKYVENAASTEKSDENQVQKIDSEKISVSVNTESDQIGTLLDWTFECFVALGQAARSNVPIFASKKAKYEYFRKKYADYREKRIERDAKIVETKLNRANPLKEVSNETISKPSLEMITDVNNIKIDNETIPPTQLPISCVLSQTGVVYERKPTGEVIKKNKDNCYLATSFAIQQSTNSPVVDAQLVAIFGGRNLGLNVEQDTQETCAESAQNKFMDVLKRKLNQAPSLTDLDIWNVLKLVLKDVENSITNKPFSDTTVAFALIINGSVWTVNLGDTHILLADGSKYKDLSLPAVCRDESLPNSNPYYKKFLHSIEVREGEIREDADGIKRLGGTESLRAIRKRSPPVKGNSTRPQISKFEISGFNIPRLFLFSSHKIVESVGRENLINMTKLLPLERAANIVIENALQKGCIGSNTVIAMNLKS